MAGLTVSAGMAMAAGLIIKLVTLRKRKKKKREAILLEMANLTSMNKDLEKGAGQEDFLHQFSNRNQ